MKTFYLVVYYLFASKLPASFQPFGRFGRMTRYFLVKHVVKKCGSNVNVENKANIGRGDRLEIGDNSGIGQSSRICGPVAIGKNVMMGPEVLMLALSHKYDNPDLPINVQGNKAPRKIVIENDVWIGARVIILPGVRVGKGSIIGAGSVVTKSIPPYSVAAGNPAKVVRNRK